MGFTPPAPVTTATGAQLIVDNATAADAGKVLTATAAGKAGWAAPPSGGGGGGVPLERAVAEVATWFHSGKSMWPATWKPFRTYGEPIPTLQLTHDGWTNNDTVTPVVGGWFLVSALVQFAWSNGSAPVCAETNLGGYNFNNNLFEFPVTSAGGSRTYPGFQASVSTQPLWIPDYGLDGDLSGYICPQFTFSSDPGAAPHLPSNPAIPGRVQLTIDRLSF